MIGHYNGGMNSVQKKVALFTGCSSGIGLYCAQKLNRHPSWRVLATARRANDVERLTAEGLESLELDLDSSESVRNAVVSVLARTDGRIDALFNNGAYGQPGALEDLPRDALRRQFETNVFGTQELTNAVIAVMRQNGGGRIIQNSSVVGFVPLKYRGAYNASKYALEGLSDTMRLELAGSGISVILIEPGPITSEFRKNADAKFVEVFDDDMIARSVHREIYENRLKSGTSDPPFNLGPEAVYKALLHALESRRPKTRYRVTVPTHVFWWLKHLLPTTWLDRLLGRFI